MNSRMDERKREKQGMNTSQCSDTSAADHFLLKRMSTFYFILGGYPLFSFVFHGVLCFVVE